jgi:hypothetical protein
MYRVLSKKVVLSAQVFFIVLVRYFNCVVCSFNCVIRSFDRVVRSFNRVVRSFNRVVRSFNRIVRSVYINNPFSKAMQSRVRRDLRRGRNFLFTQMLAEDVTACIKTLQTSIISLLSNPNYTVP